MSNSENANGIADNAKQKMIGKSFEVDAPQVAFASHVRFRRFSGFLKERAQLIIELIG
jgi:hypothetical protein